MSERESTEAWELAAAAEAQHADLLSRYVGMYRLALEAIRDEGDWLGYTDPREIARLILQQHPEEP